MKTQRRKAITRMNTKELALETAEFDREFICDTFEEPDVETQKRWRRVKRGRPKIGQGVQVISLSLEKGILARGDALAKRLKISRAALITRGLKAILGEYPGT